ncbi:MAG: hypothetical protein FRX48_08158 [Lasallia pustulata]|uniref:Uncharacterized protein n=1 Tax=Lasallia pustulata TaxID=136370 RepID=A0A5M8PEM9_9LECA|nr:MAG: hypothetical protein FRX48_08158 [Lasallia pustulata]
MTCSFLLFVLMKINTALHASKDSLLSDDPPKYSLADCSTAYDPCTLLPVTCAPRPQPPKLQVEIPDSQIFSPKLRARGYQHLEQQSQKEERRRRRSEREKAMAKEGKSVRGKARAEDGRVRCWLASKRSVHSTLTVAAPPLARETVGF